MLFSLASFKFRPLFCIEEDTTGICLFIHSVKDNGLRFVSSIDVKIRSIFLFFKEFFNGILVYFAQSVEHSSSHFCLLRFHESFYHEW